MFLLREVEKSLPLEASDVVLCDGLLELGHGRRNLNIGFVESNSFVHQDSCTLIELSCQ